ncbi:membrane lipoprotein [Streptomyces sp. NPDC006193]|uniref:membrane lipoprotein n=1 Tax=Streptomyces sp. NPDC006193 TaxID=3155717 RepID=UPI0033B33512
MVRAARALPLLPLLPALLTGCGAEKADTKADTGTQPSKRPAAERPARTPGPAAPERTALDARLRAMGIAPELVHVTGVPGFTLARQSVGVNGDDGFSAAYWAPGGAVLRLYTERGTADDCPDGWVCRSPAQGQVVRISGEKVPREVLRRAADAVHRPSAAELAALLPPAPAPPASSAATVPVERGDLPPDGDGAPGDGVGRGG